MREREKMSSHRRCCCGNSIIETCSVCYYIPNPLPGECEECQSGNEATVSFSSSFPSPTVRTMKTWSNVVVTNTIDNFVYPCYSAKGICNVFDENGVFLYSQSSTPAPWNPCCTWICIGTEYGEPVVQEGEFPLEIRTAGGGMQGGVFGTCELCQTYTPNTFIRSLSFRSYPIEIVFKRYKRVVSGTFISFCDYRAFINGIGPPYSGAKGSANYYHCIALSRRPNGNFTVPGTNPPQTEPQVDPNGTMFWPCRNPFGDPSFANSSGGKQFPDSIYDAGAGDEADPALLGTECTRCLDFYAQDGDQTVFDVIHSNAQPDETDLWRKKFSVIKINHNYYGDYYGLGQPFPFYPIYQDFTSCLLKENYLAQNPPYGPIDKIFAQIELYYFKPLENCATEFNNSRCFNKGTYKLFYVITKYNPGELVPEAERPYAPLPPSGGGGLGTPKWYSGTPDNLPRNDFIYPQTITLS